MKAANTNMEMSTAVREAMSGRHNNVAVDLRNLHSASREDKIKRIAVQFEEMMLETLLKSAFKEEKSESAMGGAGTMMGMRNMLWAQHISNNGGLGYQDVIERQLLEKYGNQKPETLAKQPEVQADIAIKKFAVTKAYTPVEGRISSEFGWRKDPFNNRQKFHAGVDFAVPMNTPVKSVMDGEVIFSGWQKGYGNIVTVKHADGYTSRYGHNSELTVKAGDKIKAGTVIAKSGSTGRSTGPHLHFEMRKDNRPVDPVKFLKNKNIKVS